MYKFNPSEWNTPNTYDTNFKQPGNYSGVYLLVVALLDFKKQSSKYEIMYVGSSGNLKERKQQHEVLRALKQIYKYVHFYFKELDNYIEEEKKLIKIIQPKYNTQWL